VGYFLLAEVVEVGRSKLKDIHGHYVLNGETPTTTSLVSSRGNPSTSTSANVGDDGVLSRCSLLADVVEEPLHPLVV
jgi:hypothetical protein